MNTDFEALEADILQRSNSDKDYMDFIIKAFDMARNELNEVQKLERRNKVHLTEISKSTQQNGEMNLLQAKDLKTRISRLEERNESLTEEIKNLSLKNACLFFKETELKEINKDLIAKIKEKSDHFKSQKIRAESINKEKTTIELQLNEVVLEKQRLTGSCSMMREETDQIKRDVSHLEDAKQNLEKKIMEHEQQAHDLGSQIEQLQEKQVILEKNLEDKDTTIQELQEKDAFKAKQIQNHQQEKENWVNDTNCYKTQIEKQNELLLKEEDKIQDLTNRIQVKEDALMKYAEEKLKSDENEKKLLEELSSQKDSLLKSQTEYDEIKQEITELGFGSEDMEHQDLKKIIINFKDIHKENMSSKDRISNLEEEISQKNEDLKKYHDNQEVLSTKNNEIVQNLSNCQQKIRELEENSRAIHEQASQLQLEKEKEKESHEKETKALLAKIQSNYEKKFTGLIKEIIDESQPKGAISDLPNFVPDTEKVLDPNDDKENNPMNEIDPNLQKKDEGSNPEPKVEKDPHMNSEPQQNDPYEGRSSSQNYRGGNNRGKNCGFRGKSQGHKRGRRY
ncbi:unnamed protein product [Moneuplotes crassus]|uniref:Uncharacterized protein n=1 Tax=Euplotes crassus TaxID=5936 RepID=A0AAD1U5B3_EUPCR|nr:unnamed protein product [Moneuplotes crassus]